MEVMMFFAFAVVAFAMIWSVQRARRKLAFQAWGRAASALSLQFSAGGFTSGSRINGTLNGFRVQVNTVRRRHGNHSRTLTVFTAYYPSLMLGLNLKKQGMLASLGKLLGGQDVEVGDSTFDRAVVVRGNKPAALRKFLTPGRRLRIRRFLSTALNARIDDRSAKFEVRGVIDSSPEIRQHLRRVVLLAECFGTEKESDRNLSEAIEFQRDGDLDNALDRLQRADSNSPEDDHEAALVEGEILLAAGDFEGAEAALAPLVDTDPEHDAESAGLVALAAERRQSVAASPSPPPVVDEVESGEPTETPLVETINALFGSDLLSFEIQRRFDDQFAGRSIRWSGSLINVTTFQTDRIFGGEAGCRATFDLTEIQSDNHFARTARAIVGLGPAARDELSSRDGDTLEFTGILAACDAFGRTIFVRGGAVTS